MKAKLIKGRLFYHITLVAKNGEVLMTSETYYSKANAERALSSLRKVLGGKK